MLKIIGKTADTGVDQVIWTINPQEGLNSFTLSFRNIEIVNDEGVYNYYFSAEFYGILSLSTFGFPPIGVAVQGLKIPIPLGDEAEKNDTFKNHHDLLHYIESKMNNGLLSKIAETFAELVHNRILRARIELSRVKRDGNNVSINLEQLLKQVVVDVVRDNGKEY